MNRFELFCMIYLALDADWNDTRNEVLGRFLSDMNPFLFKEITSAVPDIYLDYYKFVDSYVLTINNSFEVAKKYIDFVNIPEVTKSFGTLAKEQWDDALQDYLSIEHKGSGENGDIPIYA